MHIHWHKYQYTLHENWMMHIDVRECRCGSIKTVFGAGMSKDKEYYQLKDSLNRMLEYSKRYHDTRTS